VAIRRRGESSISDACLRALAVLPPALRWQDGDGRTEEVLPAAGEPDTGVAHP
jgi:hypothetical protein